MATTYIHKRTGVATNEPTASIPSGELVVNLASGKLRTTRSIIEGTLVGEVASATATSIVLTANVPAFLPSSTQNDIVLRSTTSGTANNAPAISTAVFETGPATGTNITISGLKGDVFTVGDFVWAETGTAVEETIVLSGQTTSGPNRPPEPQRGDIWIDTSAATGTPVVMIYDGTLNNLGVLIHFVLFESGGGGGGGGGDFSGTSLSDPNAEDMDFGPIGLLADTATALDTTYSAVDYDFGRVRSPRPGPNFGSI